MVKKFSLISMTATAVQRLISRLGAKKKFGEVENGAFKRCPRSNCQRSGGNGGLIKTTGGKIFIVLYSYPAATTRGCAKQACSYRDDLSNFTAGGRMNGVSGDEVEKPG
jgi:hypothetical protein